MRWTGCCSCLYWIPSCFVVEWRQFFLSVIKQPNLGIGHYTHTPGRTPLNEWSACHRDCYLHNTTSKRDKHPYIHWGLKPTISAIKWYETCALDLMATGININKVCISGFFLKSQVKQWLKNSRQECGLFRHHDNTPIHMVPSFRSFWQLQSFTAMLQLWSVCSKACPVLIIKIYSESHLRCSWLRRQDNLVLKFSRMVNTHCFGLYITLWSI